MLHSKLHAWSADVADLLLFSWQLTLGGGERSGIFWSWGQWTGCLFLTSREKERTSRSFSLQSHHRRQFSLEQEILVEALIIATSVRIFLYSELTPCVNYIIKKKCVKTKSTLKTHVYIKKWSRQTPKSDAIWTYKGILYIQYIIYAAIRDVRSFLSY